MRRGEAEHRQIRLALAMTWGMEQLMDRHSDDTKWSEQVANDFQEKVKNYLALVTAIASHYHNRGYLLFN
eukprot:6435842-Alexandrium_andersonii.AAC.1